MTRLSWPPIIERAREIVESYDILITLRQLYYRLVSAELIENKQYHYSRLSELTAELRRVGGFPALSDRGRRILRPLSFSDVSDSLGWLAGAYRRDRTEGQPVALYLGVEKNALAGLMQDWFTDLGIPILPLGGYSSESLDRDVRDAIAADGRKAVLIYAGDFDASGMDIGRSFVETTAGCWAETIRIGLSEAQIYQQALPVLRGKHKDPRAPGFIERFPEIHARHDFGTVRVGRRVLRVPVQVELDALDPALLHTMFREAIGQFWDTSEYEAARVREQVERDALADLADRWER